MAWFNLGSHSDKALKPDSRGGTSSHAAQRLRHGFIVAQIALAFVLLAGAGLLGLSLRKAMEVSPGFRPDGILAGRIALPWKSYPDKPSRLSFAGRLVDAASRLPGVAAAGLVTDVPVNGEHDTDVFTISGYTPAFGGPPAPHSVYFVAGRYFAAMGIPLLEGRLFQGGDANLELRNCVVDEDFARTYWPNGRALGARFFRGTQEGKPSEAFTVVGVVGVVKQASLTAAKSARAVYFPFEQPEYPPSRFFVVARTSQTPEFLSPSLQKARIADSLVARRSPAVLAGVFAGAALLLAAIGTYGVLAFAVAERSREIGVRMALGALPKQIAARFLGLGLRLFAAGAILGLIGVVAAGRMMRSFLFNVPPAHMGMLAASVMVMALVSFAACLLPSLRAAKVDPMVALRAE